MLKKQINIEKYIDLKNKRTLPYLLGLSLTLWAAWMVSQDGDVSTPDESLVNTKTVSSKNRSSNKVSDAPTLPESWPIHSVSLNPIEDIFSPPAPPPVVSKNKNNAASGGSESGEDQEVTFGLKYVGRIQDSGITKVFFTDSESKVITVKVGQMITPQWLLVKADIKKIVIKNTKNQQEYKVELDASE